MELKIIMPLLIGNFRSSNRTGQQNSHRVSGTSQALQFDETERCYFDIA